MNVVFEIQAIQDSRGGFTPTISIECPTSIVIIDGEHERHMIHYSVIWEGDVADTKMEAEEKAWSHLNHRIKYLFK